MTWNTNKETYCGRLVLDSRQKKQWHIKKFSTGKVSLDFEKISIAPPEEQEIDLIGPYDSVKGSEVNPNQFNDRGDEHTCNRVQFFFPPPYSIEKYLAALRFL